MSKYPNRVLVYGIEGDCPMFFSGDGRGSEIFPTGTDKLGRVLRMCIYAYVFSAPMIDCIFVSSCLSNQCQISISRYLTIHTRVLSVALNKLNNEPRSS